MFVWVSLLNKQSVWMFFFFFCGGVVFDEGFGMIFFVVFFLLFFVYHELLVFKQVFFSCLSFVFWNGIFGGFS